MSHSVSGITRTIAPAGEKKSIFRSKALRSYAGREQKSASYTLITPRSLYLLWALVLLTVFLGVITWLSEIPVYIPAVAVTTERPALQDEPAIILIFIPADQLGNLRLEQNVVLSPGASPSRAIAKIFAIEPESLSAQAAQERFAPRIKFSNAGEPRAVALARLVQPESNMFPGNRGGPIDVWIQIDSKPVVSLLPSIRRAIQPSAERQTNGLNAYTGFVRATRIARVLRCLSEESLQSEVQRQTKGSLYFCSKLIASGRQPFGTRSSRSSTVSYGRNP